MATHRIYSPNGRTVYEFDSTACRLTHFKLAGEPQWVHLGQEDADALDTIQNVLMDNTYIDGDTLHRAAMAAYAAFFAKWES